MTDQQKIFGLGFSKTGTTSLEKALALLDYKVCAGHFNNNYTNYLIALYVNKDYKELMKFTTLFDAFADGPWGGGDLYKHLYEKYPQAHYILTIRDPEKWYNSFEKMITRFDANLGNAFDSFYANGRYGTPYFFKHIFQIETMEGSKDKMIAYYNRYNQEVQDFFKVKGAPLLVIDITNGDEWNTLCPFINQPIPEKAFPHENPAHKKTVQGQQQVQNTGLIRKVLRRLKK